MVTHDLDRAEVRDERFPHRLPRDQKVLIVRDDDAIFRRANLRARRNPVRELGPAFEFLSPAFTLDDLLQIVGGFAARHFWVSPKKTLRRSESFARPWAS